MVEFLLCIEYARFGPVGIADHTIRIAILLMANPGLEVETGDLQRAKTAIQTAPPLR